jgi:hypothetical protein
VVSTFLYKYTSAVPEVYENFQVQTVCPIEGNLKNFQRCHLL